MLKLTFSRHGLLLSAIAIGGALFLLVLMSARAANLPNAKLTRVLNLNDKLVVKSQECVQKIKVQTDPKIVIRCTAMSGAQGLPQTVFTKSSIDLNIGDRLTVKANGCRLVVKSTTSTRTVIKCAFAQPTATATATSEVENTATFTASPTEILNTPTSTATSTPTGEPTETSTATPTATGTYDWLGSVNGYREMADIPAVSENPTWSYGDYLHSRYMVKNDVIDHTEDAGNPWYTDEGLAAAQNSDLIVSSSANMSDKSAIDGWMSAPFHAVGIIDPALGQVGYNSYREADGGYQTGAGLDVLRGLGNVPGSVTFPVEWPGDGKTVNLTSYNGNEYPDPLTACPGYGVPAGLPIILQVGDGSVTPSVTAHTLMQGATALEHCIFDETNYTNGDSNQQTLVRNILGARDAIILIPRAQLQAGLTYAVSVTSNGNTYAWSFSVAGNAVNSAGPRNGQTR